jgi:hypothetical protein
MTIKNGRIARPAPKSKPVSLDDIFGNTLSVDPAVAASIEKKGLEYRFISAAKLQANAGYHHRAWRAIKLKDIEGFSGDAFGSDPDGYYRRGDLVLAVRSKELGDKHRTFLKQENARNNARLANKKHAQEMREYVKDNNLEEGMTVHEGYGKDDE